MSKTSKKKHTRRSASHNLGKTIEKEIVENNITTAPQKKPLLSFRKLPKWFYGFLGFCSIVLSFYIGYLTFFKPDLVIKLTAPMDSNNPMSAPIIITNNSFFTIDSISLSFKVIETEVLLPGNIVQPTSSNIWVNIVPAIGSLSSKEEMTYEHTLFMFGMGIPNSRTISAKIALAFKYEYLSQYFSDTLYFKTIMDDKFNLHWYPSIKIKDNIPDSVINRFKELELQNKN